MKELHAFAPLPVIPIAMLAVVFLLSLLADGTGRRTLPRWLWTMATGAAALVLVQAGAGVALLLDGARARAPLHPMYGLLASGFAAAIVLLRPGSAYRKDGGRLREGRLLTVVSISLIALLLRAQATVPR